MSLSRMLVRACRRQARLAAISCLASIALAASFFSTAEELASYESKDRWRVAETRADQGLFAGAEIDSNDVAAALDNRGIAFAQKESPFFIEKVSDYDLEDLMLRHRPAPHEPWSIQSVWDRKPPRDLCAGRFLLNDPRVGLFNNQRISYETAIMVAAALGRTLVLPGFFKFPHPNAYDGTEWVPVHELFNWTVLEACNATVIELGDLIEQCGEDLLDNHVTVPFELEWMQSKSKAPWINGTRPHLRWQAPAGGKIVHLRSKETSPVVPLGFEDQFWRILRAFLQPSVAEARVVRTHGLMAQNTSIYVPICFLPTNSVFEAASAMFSSGLEAEPDEPQKVLGLHVRLFKQSVTESGGYVQPELAERQLSLCNLEPLVFVYIVALYLRRVFAGFWPTHTYFASNEVNASKLTEYFSGLPGARMNSFLPPAMHDHAVTSAECAEALRSVLVDAVVLAQADYFVGNVCSTQSQYIINLRRYLGKSFFSGVMIGGDGQASLISSVREMMEK